MNLLEQAGRKNALNAAIKTFAGLITETKDADAAEKDAAVLTAVDKNT